MLGRISTSQLNTGSHYNRLNDEIVNSANRHNAAKKKASNDYGQWGYQTGTGLSKQQSSIGTTDKITRMKQMIRGDDKKKNQYGMSSTLESLQSYSEQLKASRENAKKTSAELKKLKYNFKDISGQIRRSKTSANAKQVANKARREVVMLKMKQQSGQYDEEEISAAITHAQAMERAAKKKARHLMEEEMIKITDDAPSQRDKINIEEQIEAERDKALEEIDKEMQALEEQLNDISKEQMQEMQESMEESQEEMQEMTQEAMEEMSSEMFDEMSQMMQDMMEDTFSDMMDSIFTVVDFEMTEDDFKELVKKHRTSEDKDMVKADMEYLKAMFDRYSKMLDNAKSGGGGSIGSQAGMQGISGVSSSPIVSGVSMPVDVNVSVPEGGSIDVSV